MNLFVTYMNLFVTYMNLFGSIGKKKSTAIFEKSIQMKTQ